MSYSILSKYYDRLMSDFDYDGYAEFILKNVRGKTGLDLAAGSGEMTVRLSKAGFTMTGADISDEMLNAAVVKARKAFRDIMFIKLDLNDFVLYKKYDFITAVCDGFNYIESESGLKKAFAEAYSALNGGGTLIFDLSAKRKLERIAADEVFYSVDDDLTYIWTNEIEGNRVDMCLTFFERQPDGRYVRYDEEQSQYFYESETVARLLTEAGFETEIFDGGFLPYGEKSDRAVFVARKRARTADRIRNSLVE